MTSRQTLFLSTGLFIFWLLAITLLRSNFGTHIRFFSDEVDRKTYFERGSWLPTGQVPYRDVLSEYPQVPTFFFGLLQIPVLGEQNEERAYLKFSSLFSFSMLVILFALVDQIYRLLPNAKYRAFLLLLPALLYFTFNRFDVLPAYLCLVSFLMIKNQKWAFAAILLGIAAMTKWYPILLLPAYIVYCYYVTGTFNWRMILIFSVTCFLITLPTLLAGGIDALLVPYRFQGVRGLETLTFPEIINEMVITTLKKTIAERYYVIGFLLLQVIAAPIAFFAKPDKIEKLLEWCILIITLFVLFSRIYSPQWCLWILPFLIVVSRTKFDVAIIIFYGVITYVAFPIFHDLFGRLSDQMFVMGLINLAMLIFIAGRSIWKLYFFEKTKSVQTNFPNLFDSSSPIGQE